MTKSDLEKIFIKMGVPEGVAKECAEEELQDKLFAYLAAYNPLDDPSSTLDYINLLY